MITYRPAVGAALEALGERNARPVRAIPTPFGSWSHNCMGRGGQIGLAHGWHVLAAGPTGMGKTFLAVNVAAAAVAAGEAVTFHSLEMDWDEITTRALSIVSGVPSYRLSPGKYYSAGAFEMAAEKMNMARGQLIPNDEPLFKLSDLLDGIRRGYEQHGSRLHIVDYLQLAWTAHESQREQITEVSHRVRQLAKELGVVTFCLSQLNRSATTSDEKPRKENMIGGSALENDSDQVLLLDRSRQKFVIGADGQKKGWIGWLMLDKNRHGPSTEIPIRYDADTGRIRERLADEIHDFEVDRDKEIRE